MLGISFPHRQAQPARPQLEQSLLVALDLPGLQIKFFPQERCHRHRVQDTLRTDEEPSLDQCAHGRPCRFPEHLPISEDEQEVIEIVHKEYLGGQYPPENAAKLVWHKYGLYFQPNGRRDNATGGAPGAGRKRKICRAPGGRQKLQTAFLRSMWSP